MPRELNILAISGSLRRQSFNTALLRAAQELSPQDMNITIWDRLRDIPMYDEDLRSQGDPEAVTELKEAMSAADGILIATPEYNYSIPGVLKNAIDWVSRPADTTPLAGKPAGIIGASMGNFGTARGQLALRQVFVFTNTLAMQRPELLVFTAQNRFDQNLRLTDETTRELLRDYLGKLGEWVRFVGSERRQPALV